ncbi:uncharacterized protein KIAA1143 homolog [Fopius arisanus]|uniref:Uncharacterized protein KIAA1143 homolog n=1 Tax=Fopius arisanus TaxID=64838 RepID=A0A9R1TQX5_9HYME|nr:PREDICTED: uncharacterized protein KIAA1143 homolog [Fopius arisanus]
MSRKKHNISYIKPEDPKFLRDLKAAAGYKEGPDLDTKRQELPNIDDDDDDHLCEEKPTVVVLKQGDLTAEEADDFEKTKKAEEENAPADLTKRIVFESKRKSKSQAADQDSTIDSKMKKRKKSKQSKSVLSFNEDEDE